MTTPSHVTHKSVLQSHEFYLGAGTVTVDRRARKALILFDRHSGLYGLPRGRADWGESVSEAAIRETLEEGGVSCRLLPVPVPSRSTPPPANSRHHQPQPSEYFFEEGVHDAIGEVTRGVLLTEPFALLSHFRQNGALAVVHWFVAEGDSEVPLQLGGQMADEDYTPLWVTFEEAVRAMPDANHAGVVQRALELVDRLDWIEKAAAAAAAAAAHVNPASSSSARSRTGLRMG